MLSDCHEKITRCGALHDKSIIGQNIIILNKWRVIAGSWISSGLAPLSPTLAGYLAGLSIRSPLYPNVAVCHMAILLQKSRHSIQPRVFSTGFYPVNDVRRPSYTKVAVFESTIILVGHLPDYIILWSCSVAGDEVEASAVRCWLSRGKVRR